jgi:hypothetical protein
LSFRAGNPVISRPGGIFPHPRGNRVRFTKNRPEFRKNAGKIVPRAGFPARFNMINNEKYA